MKTDATRALKSSKNFPLSGIMLPFYIPVRGAGVCRRMPVWDVSAPVNCSRSCSGAYPTVGWALALRANGGLPTASLLAGPIPSRREGRLHSLDRLATLYCGVMIDESH
jgi:hypothetical protein